METVNHAFIESVYAISMAGESSDQNEAAIMIPAEKPSIPSINSFLG